MKIQAWILAVALALAFGGAEAAAQGVKSTRSPTAPVTSKGTKTSAKPGTTRAVPESSLGSASRRALLGGKAAAGKSGQTTSKLEKPRVKS